MAVAGRKPKPPELRIIEGNPGHRPIPENTPKPAPKKPSCPRWLLPDAKKEWHRVAPMLEKLGLLTKIDMAALAGYCQSYARWKDCEEEIDRNGYTVVTEKGFVIQHPAVSIAKNCLNMVRKFCSEFGMTPSSRGRIQIPGLDDEDDEDLD